MSGDCSSIATTTPHVVASKPQSERVYPISAIRCRTSRGMSTYVCVVISPATTTRPVVISVSHATRPSGSSARTASRTLSEIWSAILSGCPSVTDSDVKRNSRSAIGPRTLPHVDEHPAARVLEIGGRGEEHGAQRLEVPLHVGRDRVLAERRQHADDVERPLQVDPEHDVL